jgi:hypothetical protein
MVGNALTGLLLPPIPDLYPMLVNHATTFGASSAAKDSSAPISCRWNAGKLPSAVRADPAGAK